MSLYAVGTTEGSSGGRVLGGGIGAWLVLTGLSLPSRRPRLRNINEVCKKSVLIGGMSVGSRGSIKVVSFKLWSMKNILPPLSNFISQLAGSSFELSAK